MTHMVIKRLRRSQRRKYKLLMEQVENIYLGVKIMFSPEILMVR